MTRLDMVNRLRVSALEMSDKEFEQFVQMMRNRRNHGFYHCIDYALNSWGTKWNAYGQNPEANTQTKVTFETAWSHPFSVIQALSKKFPNEQITVKFADEATGSNCGYYTMQNGELLVESIAHSWSDQTDDEKKKKWTEFAFRFYHSETNPREYGYNENWVYDENLEDE
ncbi:hypothetical protein OO184_19330 [Photorhabdus sp. APURE]|uniref:DUF1281 family ferredoxin-like fold protein n=1 Tax=Photorhabdus aballayi TaxID=2991723 RepID=UPI00223DC862|nr:hypothetical protein [Photorhabdus aballayi]MCW7550023.1 hypothetical protein [Photorhabdus aballayi]